MWKKCTPLSLSYTVLRAHETDAELGSRVLSEKNEEGGGGGIQVRVDRYEIAGSEEGVEFGVLHVGAGLDQRLHRRVVGEDAHLESLGAAMHALPDPPEAHDAEHLAPAVAAPADVGAEHERRTPDAVLPGAHVAGG